MLYREYPEKSFKSFSLLANALPVGIPAEGLGSGILQLGVECFSRTDLPPILRESFFLKDIFRLKDWVQESFSWGWNVSAELIFLRFLGNRFS